MSSSPTVTRLGALGSSWAVLRLIALTLVIRIRVARARGVAALCRSFLLLCLAFASEL